MVPVLVLLPVAVAAPVGRERSSRPLLLSLACVGMGACPLTEPEALCSGFEERGLRVRKKGKLQRQRGRRQGGTGRVQSHCGAGPGFAES